MRFTNGQLKRIIREEYSRLKRRGLIKESLQDNHAGTASAELNAVCLDMGMTMGEARRMSALYTKIDDCVMQSMPHEQCANMLDDNEYMMLARLQQCLMKCKHEQCKEMLVYTKRL